jgi:PIN domain nuclease of toxin-antitoxin system
MRISLDTHILLWALVGSPRLSARARALILDHSNAIVVSGVVLWEIAIKHALNRGEASDMPIDAQRARTLCTKAGYEELPIGWDAAARVASLPKLHADPFDRMLLAQTIATDLWLLTNDAKIVEYGGQVLTN